MARLLVANLPPVDPARFARLARGLLQRPAGEPALLLAPLTGAAVLLGRHQRRASALREEAVARAGLPVIRRAGGGRALLAGEGVLGVVAAAPPGAALFPGPFAVDKVTNRYVRGLLAGLRAAGARGAAWFGRDFVSSASRRVALLAQEGTAEGGTGLEAWVAVSRDLALPEGLSAYPAHGDPRAAGPPPDTVSAQAGRALDPAEVAAAVAAGYAAAAGLEAAPFEGPLPEAPDLPTGEDEAGFTASGVADVPCGFVEALVRAGGGAVLEARLRGDLTAPAFAWEALERSLAGCPLRYPELGRRVDEAFRRPGAFVHGLADLAVLAEAVLAAAGDGPGGAPAGG
jgi:hypothetical protein